MAFVIEKILDEWADWLSDRPVSLDESNEVYRQLHQPLGEAIEFLNGSAEEPLLIAAELIKVRPGF